MTAKPPRPRPKGTLTTTTDVSPQATSIRTQNAPRNLFMKHSLRRKKRG